MDTILYLGIFWTVYGVIGLFGFQVIPSKYKGYSWTRDYIRLQAKTWLMLGVPWVALSLILPALNISRGWTTIAIIVVAIPSLVYSGFIDRKYQKLVNENINKG